MRHLLKSIDSALYNSIVRFKGVLFCFTLSITLATCNQTHDTKEQDPKGRLDTSSGNTIEVILQQTLDAKELQAFLHPTEPGRSILCVTGIDLPVGMRLEKHGHPVRVVDSIDECENCLVFESIVLGDTTTRVTIHYPIEGLRGEFYFTQSANHWMLISSELTEN